MPQLPHDHSQADSSEGMVKYAVSCHCAENQRPTKDFVKVASTGEDVCTHCGRAWGK